MVSPFIKLIKMIDTGEFSVVLVLVPIFAFSKLVLVNLAHP